ncbi:Fic family protein [Corynebacterium aquatimens]
MLKAVVNASRELAALNMACELIPNPDVITSTIPLREAQASTEIENIVTTNDELFRANWQIDAEPSPAAKEALRYSLALRRGVELTQKYAVSEKLAIEVCSALQGHQAQIRSTPGTFIGDPVAQKVRYTPPSGKQIIEQHLSAWERYLYSEHGLDPLVLMALAHYQFEAIHPFYDGNGRTGRILNILLLLQERVLNLPVLYMSGFIVDNKSKYYELLTGVTERGEWDNWIIFMVSAVEKSARDAREMIIDLRTAQADVEAQIRRVGISAAHELGNLLFEKPYVRISDLEEAKLAHRQTASVWLSKLVDAGVLEETKAGRSKVFVNTVALEILTRR